MRILRLLALVGSLTLLVATAVSVVNQRSDELVDQTDRIDDASALAVTSVRDALADVRQDVYVAAETSARNGGVDSLDHAHDLMAFLPGGEVCVGTTAAGCTGADLFASATVGDLAAASARLDLDSLTAGGLAAASLVATDPATDSVYIVRRIALPSDGVAGSSTVAIRLPIDALLGDATGDSVDRTAAEVEVSVSGRSALDDRVTAMIDGRRTVTETVASPFVSGSLTIESSVDGTVRLAGDRTTTYGLLLALGTILLVLAAWTIKVERRRLERIATTDDLTGLINRREFERISETALDFADRFNDGLCVMVVDLNGFKQVNDTLGHQFGDRVLKASSERLVEAVRATDIVARWGGDEFVILLPGLADRSAVRRSAERIYSNLSGSPVVGDTLMSGSIGAAIFPRHGQTIDTLMRAADIAMYEAKTNGVSHRIADTVVVSESPTVAGTAFDTDLPIVSTHYTGPDRRQSIPAELVDADARRDPSVVG